MPWQERTRMSERHEFVSLACQPGANISSLARRYGISRTTAYKWLDRYATAGVTGLVDQSRRPATSPRRTSDALERHVLALRDANPSWGGRKLQQVLRDAGVADVPAPSTITAILARHGRLHLDGPPPLRQPQRFEHPEPNDLWQLDFMGHRRLQYGRVHPLTLLDDHSRFGLALVACDCEQQALVQQQLTAAFTRYGLPRRILTDNGPPWGTSGAGGWTALEIWLIQLGIGISHGRPAHPQTQGKVERWHATIQTEVFRFAIPLTLASCQVAFDHFRDRYNLERPHQALAYVTPASRYQPSPRSFPSRLPPVEYGPDDLVRKVNPNGIISLDNQRHFVGRGLAGTLVALRPTTIDGHWTVHFCHQQVATLDQHHDPIV
jgi:transposase InsO family protein